MYKIYELKSDFEYILDGRKAELQFKRNRIWYYKEVLKLEGAPNLEGKSATELRVSIKELKMEIGILEKELSELYKKRYTHELIIVEKESDQYFFYFDLNNFLQLIQ